jgi:hypothetical protein
MRLQTAVRSSASTCHAGTSGARNINQGILHGMPLDPNVDILAQQVDVTNDNPTITPIAKRRI